MSKKPLYPSVILASLTYAVPHLSAADGERGFDPKPSAIESMQLTNDGNKLLRFIGSLDANLTKKSMATFVGHVVGNSFMSDDQQAMIIKILIIKGFDIQTELYFSHLDETSSLVNICFEHNLFKILRTIITECHLSKNEAYKAKAVEKNFLDIIQIFHFPIASKKDPSSSEYLFAAIKNGWVNSVIHLVKVNHNLNITDDQGETPLSYAIMRQDMRIVKILIQQGANPSVKARWGNNVDGVSKSPLDYALEKGQENILQILQNSKFYTEKRVEPVKKTSTSTSTDGVREEKSDADVLPDYLQALPFIQYKGKVKKTFEEVYAGQAPEAINDFRSILASKEDYSEWNPEEVNTILLHGPSGTGKTTLAYAIACEAGLPFFKVGPSAFVSKWVGESSKNLTLIFENIYRFSKERNTKVVLLIDEIDASFGEWKTSNEGHQAQVSSVFLNYFGEQAHDPQYSDFLKNIILVGTTNYMEKLPENVLSRFYHVIEISKPDKAARESVIRYHLGQRKRATVSDREISSLAQLSEGLNCRQIVHAIEKASTKAFIAKMNIQFQHLKTQFEVEKRVQEKRDDPERRDPPHGMYS